MTEINKRSPSNKRVALGKKVRINNRRGYYYSIGKSSFLGFLKVGVALGSLVFLRFH